MGSTDLNPKIRLTSDGELYEDDDIGVQVEKTCNSCQSINSPFATRCSACGAAFDTSYDYVAGYEPPPPDYSPYDTPSALMSPGGKIFGALLGRNIAWIIGGIIELFRIGLDYLSRPAKKK